MDDQVIECVECGRVFVWSWGEQRYYRQHGLSAPKRCTACRARRRLEREPGMRSLRDAPVDDSRSPIGHRTNRAAPWRSQARARWSVWDNADWRSGLPVLATVVILAAAVWRVCAPLSVAWSWLIAVSVVTFLTYLYDKMASRLQLQRVSEKVLLALAAAGGTISAVAAMLLIRHKTAKRSFQLRLLSVALIQFVLVVAYLLIKG